MRIADDLQTRVDALAEVLRVEPDNISQQKHQKEISSLTYELGQQDPFIVRLNHQLMMIRQKFFN